MACAWPSALPLIAVLGEYGNVLKEVCPKWSLTKGESPLWSGVQSPGGLRARALEGRETWMQTI